MNPSRKSRPKEPFFSARKSTAQPGQPRANGQRTALLGRRKSSPSTPKALQSNHVSGFSDPSVVAGSAPYTDYKLVTTKRDMLDGMRYHIMRLGTPVDITKDAQFPKPARLLRRDPRAVIVAPVKDEMDESKDGLNQEQREMLNRRKEERQRERELNIAMIAPSAGPARKTVNFKKKTQQVFRPELTEKDKQRIQTNYEETLPWHLEDFDNRHCLVGRHKQGYAQTNLAFALDPSSGKCRVFPVEKVYNFDQRRDHRVPNLTIEEAEKAMKKRGPEPEWLIRHQEARQMERAKEVVAKRAKGLFSGAQVDTFAGRQGEEADLDFDDDFADDEEGALLGDEDEDQKLADKKVKEDHLLANQFGMKTEGEYDRAEEEEKKEAEERRRNFPGIRKALEKREGNYNHGSDSEGSYGTSDDSEEERERLEKARLAKLAEDGEEKNANLSSSGTNTPSGQKEKHDEPGLPRSGSSKSLKRPGSPNLSEASGTDVSRKKKHKSRHTSSSQPTPQPSRPTSPSDQTGARRAFSPKPQSAPAQPAAAPDKIPFPTVEQIRAAIPAEGISFKDFVRRVSHPKERRQELIKLVGAVARVDKETKLLMPRS